MGHITSKNFLNLQKRLDKSPQGAPASDSLFKILEVLFTEEEAEFVSKLPINTFTLKKAAGIWKISVSDAEKILNDLCDKAILVDFKRGDEVSYVLAPPMAGFFEFSLMRTDGKFDTKVLSELYHQYLNTEDAFGKRVFGLNPPIGRCFIHEDTIPKKDIDIVLDYERASKVIENATFCVVGRCYCRHKMGHNGSKCVFPQDNCLSFGETARSLAKHGVAREITKREAKAILDKSVKLGLVQVGSNMQNGVSWICNCCGCCCEALLAYKKLGYNPRIHTNWFAINNVDVCSSCGVCVKKCPVNAISLVKVGVENPRSFAVIDVDRCIGCGVCTRFCPSKSLSMKRRKDTNFVPVDTFERFVLDGIDSGTLQNLIFDNYHLWPFGVLRAFLGIIFKLPPAKWLLANRQLQSRFLNAVGNYYLLKNPEVVDGNFDYSHPELKFEFGRPKK